MLMVCIPSLSHEYIISEKKAYKNNLEIYLYANICKEASS